MSRSGPEPAWYRRVSLRARLTVAYALAMAVILAMFGALVYVQLGRLLLDQVDTTLQSRADGLLAQFGGPAVPHLADDRLLDPDEAFADVIDHDGRLLGSTSGVRSAPLLDAAEVASLSSPTMLTRRVPGLDDDARLLAVPALAAGRPVVLVVGATLGDRADALQELLTLYTLIGPAALAISSLIGWGLAGAALRPVGLMTRRAADLRRDQRVHGRLPVPPTGDELTRLAVTLNDMLDGLEELLDRERRFVDRASHEIRTPLAILKARIDVATSRSRTAEELSLILAGVGRDTDRIVRLAEDLLVLARTRPEGLPVRLEDVGLPEFLASVAAPFAARADGEGRRVSVDAESVTARLDATRLRQAVENLLENALRHGQGGVQVTARTLDGLLRIDVTDEGGGFGDDVLAHAFEPFRRGRHGPGEGARHGAGLGLAVVLAVAQAHGGTATARNLPGRGAGVRLDVPLSGRI